MSKEEFITVKEAARILKLNIMTIYGYIQRGHIRAMKIGRNYRISVKEFEKFIRRNSL